MTERHYPYWDADQAPDIFLHPGDILFMAGRDEHPPFEHVALVYEPVRLIKDADFGDIVIIGLPESDPREPTPTADYLLARCGTLHTRATRNTKWWRRDRGTGHPVRVWNLVGRVLPEMEAVYFMDRLRHRAARLDILYAAQFALEPRSRLHPLMTNCVGFVCWAYQNHGVALLYEGWPQYRGQYRAEFQTGVLCDYPRPGHIARAISAQVSLPYRCENSAEAEKYCTAYQTLAELRSGARSK